MRVSDGGLWAVLALVAGVAGAAEGGAAFRFRDPAVPMEERVADLLGRLTVEEKTQLCSGGFAAPDAAPIVPRLGIPPLMMLDGRQGVRPLGAEKDTVTTLLPCALALGCTWDPGAAERFGRVLAAEMLALDRHVLLAPMINVIRSPLGGRNFENFSEDPFHGGTIAAACVRGVQSLGVGACSCLVAGNDCERHRHFTSSNMDERTLREVHLLPTEMTVADAGVWTMMSANSLLNGLHCAHHRRLLQEIVKDRIGFDGVTITDWRAAYDTDSAALAGTDMTTGYCRYVFGDGRLLDAVRSGRVPPEVLDDKVRRILRLYFRCGAFDPASRGRGERDSASHRAAARSLAAQGMVLLANRGGLLPLVPSRVRSVLITGPAADRVLQGGGSGHVPAAVNVTPLAGLRAALGGSVRITHVPYPVELKPVLRKANVEWEAPAGASGRGGSAAGAVPEPAALAEAARTVDLVVFVAAGALASEGSDLPDMTLPGRQAEAIAAVAAANANVVVVLAANGAVSLDPWLDAVPAVLAIHYSGQATGQALADVLTGAAEPGGRLAYTFARRLEDYPCHALGEWPARLILDRPPSGPGMTPAERKATHAYDTDYKEGVLVGHRWLDARGTEPVFPFGHGLGYTTFRIGDLRVAETGGALRVSCSIRNDGQRAGAEVVQVYVAPPPGDATRPPLELKGFARVALDPGDVRRVEIPLRVTALARFDASTQSWKAPAGVYGIRVGCSSRDLRLGVQVTNGTERVFPRF